MDPFPTAPQRWRNLDGAHAHQEVQTLHTPDMLPKN
jgi:hypothetical protein